MVQTAMKLHAALATVLLFAQGEDEHCTIAAAVATAFWAGWLLARGE